MNTTLAKILLLGVPLLLSLSWFAFWVVKLLKTAKKLKSKAANKVSGDGSLPRSP